MPLTDARVLLATLPRELREIDDEKNWKMRFCRLVENPMSWHARWVVVEFTEGVQVSLVAAAVLAPPSIVWSAS